MPAGFTACHTSTRHSDWRFVKRPSACEMWVPWSEAASSRDTSQTDGAHHLPSANALFTLTNYCEGIHSRGTHTHTTLLHELFEKNSAQSGVIFVHDVWLTCVNIVLGAPGCLLSINRLGIEKDLLSDASID